VQEYLDWAVEAEIIQAVGRGRATLRSPDQPLEVYLLTAVVTSLPVDRLTHISDLIGERQAERMGATFNRRRAELNRHRADDARRRVFDAVLNIQAAGGEVGVNEVARRAGADKRTVAKFLATLSTPHIRGVVDTGTNIKSSAICSHYPSDKRDSLADKGFEALREIAATGDSTLGRDRGGPPASGDLRPSWRK
jgi:hypothetical protein